MSQSFRDSDRDSGSSFDLSQVASDVVRRIQSDPLLAAAIASLGVAAALELAGRTKAARVVGFWAPTLLLFGMYRRSLPATDARQRRRQPGPLDLERRFEGGCASPPGEWEETIDDGYRMTAARDVDDYSERISRTFPHKAK